MSSRGFTVAHSSEIPALGAVAHEPGTTVIAFGATPGRAFEVSSWERKYWERTRIGG